MQQPSNVDGFSALQRPETDTSDFNAQTFLIWSVLNRVRTCSLVKVLAVTNNGGVSPVGFVDLQPLVNQLDGAGNSEPHAPVFDCPYFRLQGGSNAVIIDPQIGDIGIAVFADRDISSATANKGEANPGSKRKFSMADGLYLGGVLNGVPTQYVQFSTAGIKLHSPSAIVLEAPDIQLSGQTVEIVATTSATVTTPTFTVNGATVLNGPLSQGTGSYGGAATMLGPITVTNDVTAGGKSLKTHVHGGVQTGTGNTGAPV